MLYYSQKLLEHEYAKDLAKRLMATGDWVDGLVSAKGSGVKRNIQLGPEQHSKFSSEVIKLLENNENIRYSVFPKKIHSLLFTRTGSGMFYGPHVDLPHVPQGRRDLSFTLFLSEKDSYKGGELILYIPPEKKVIKLNPGEMIMYPTKYLHEVKEVTEGERMVCVGWIESQIARDEDRESLHLMKSAINDLMKQVGITQATQSLNISFNNIYKRFLN
tara:strand:- start:266 stop:916 length:651 start_codon:yes stop_codon:yes gene_type:complete